MKILLWVAHYLPAIGGLEVMTHTLATELKKTGNEILVLSDSDAKPAHEIMLDNVRVVFLPFSKMLAHYNLNEIKEIFYRLNSLIDEFNPDLVNIHGWSEIYAYYQIRIFEKRSIPYIITSHCMFLPQAVRGVHSTRLWAMASKITTVSESMVKEIEEENFSPAKKVKCIYNGLKILPTKKSLVSENFIPNIFAVGRLTEVKGFDTLFYAVKLLVEKHPKLKLVLVGGGPGYNFLIKLKSTLNLNDHIIMTGFVSPGEEVYRYLNKSCMMVIPSNYEPFGLVALEAAFHARPVVASNVNGLKEIVINSETGILVEPKNPEALAFAIDYLLSNPEKMNQMGINAEKRSRELFTVEKMTEQYLSMYKEILKEKNNEATRECYYTCS